MDAKIVRFVWPILTWTPLLFLTFVPHKEDINWTITVDNCNILYVGVDNPLSIVVCGIPEDQLDIKATGIELKKVGKRQYTARAKQPGEASITLSAPGGISQTFRFLINRLPPPVIALGGKYQSGYIDKETFKASEGLIPFLPGNGAFGCGYCDLKSFTIVRVTKRGDPKIVENFGPRFGTEARALINEAIFGDTYYFNDIKTACPGDDGVQPVGGLSFKIK